MTAATSDQNTSRYGAGGVPNQWFAPQKAATKINGGVIVVLDGGYACEGSTKLGLIVIGISTKAYDNTNGANGDNIDRRIVVDQGVFPLANSAGGDQLTQVDVGKTCYLVDNITVAKTNGLNTRSPAGRLTGFDELGRPMVQLGLSRVTSAGTELGTMPAVSGSDYAITSPASGSVYEIPLIAGASTVTLPTAAPTGTHLYFTADGTKNAAGTVTYRDGNGNVALTTALTAAKRHGVHAMKGPGGWSAIAYVSP